MKKILALLLALVGVAAVSCDHRCYYGTPGDIYEEKSAVCDDGSANADEAMVMDSVLPENTTEECN